jgi:predicted metal-dependent hydrolase
MKFDWSCGALAEGLRCYRTEEFFQAHEHWESVWLKCEQPEKTFLQALIQIAAAFHHLRRNNLSGATSLLNGALRRLDQFTAVYERIEVAPLREKVRSCLQAITVGEDTIQLCAPEIKLSNELP